MDSLRAIQELIEDADIPEGIYLKVCDHLKTIHNALTHKPKISSRRLVNNARQCWRCYTPLSVYPGRARELLRRILQLSDEDAALLSDEQMEHMTGLDQYELHIRMSEEMLKRNVEIIAERREARMNA